MASNGAATEGGKMYRSITVVDKASKCIGVVDSLLKCRMLGLDAGGVAPRSRGPISMVTLATLGRHVYIFDVKESEELFEEGNLKLLLESSKMLKIVHDFRNIAETLYNTYGVKVRHVFDTHAAYQTIAIQKGIIENKALSMDEMFVLYTRPANPESPYIKRWTSANSKCFTLRPITKCVAYYMAFNVCCLLTCVFEDQVRLIRLNYWPLLAALSDDQLGNRTNSEDLIAEALVQSVKDQERDLECRFG
ncbi:egalitarian protein homolog [Ixodes scapularis]